MTNLLKRASTRVVDARASLNPMMQSARSSLYASKGANVNLPEELRQLKLEKKN